MSDSKIKVNNLISKVLESKKYSMVDFATIEFIVKTEMQKYKKETDILKSVKNKLHQVHEMFLPTDNLPNILKQVEGVTKETAIDVANMLINYHVSTSERSGIYQEYLKQIFNVLYKLLENNQIKTIVDVGAGFNGVALWLNNYFVDSIKNYTAIDVNNLATNLLNKFFSAVNCNNAIAKTGGIFNDDIVIECEVCLMLKLLPVLINQSNGKPKVILSKVFDKIKAKVFVISFPLKSMSGKEVGMKQNYQTSIVENLPNFLQLQEIINFKNESVYIYYIN